MTRRDTPDAPLAGSRPGTWALALLLLIAACASPFEPPARVDLEPLRARAVTEVKEGIRVSAVAPTPEESRSLFGIELEAHNIQPLWLEIKNGSERPVYFLRTGLDPEYFAPQEVAFLYKDSFNAQGKVALGEHLEALSLDSRSPIVPGETISGFVYANRADPTLMADVDLIGREWSDRIGLVVPMPGTEAAEERLAALRALRTEDPPAEIADEAALRIALEDLPCCALDEAGAPKLPLNVVLIGSLRDWGPAFVRRNYRYAATSPYYAFGRDQDLSGHKISRWVAPQPHTLRAWRTALRYRGKPVWLLQVSTRRGGRFATSGEGTQPIDPDVDEARNDIVQDLLYSQAVTKLGFVGGAGPDGASESVWIPGSAAYHTDGLRAVFEFSDAPVSLAEIDFFDWERLADHVRR